MVQIQTYISSREQLQARLYNCACFCIGIFKGTVFSVRCHRSGLFHICTAALSFFRQYTAEVHMRTQMSNAVGLDIPRFLRVCVMSECADAQMVKKSAFTHNVH